VAIFGIARSDDLGQGRVLDLDEALKCFTAFLKRSTELGSREHTEGSIELLTEYTLGLVEVTIVIL